MHERKRATIAVVNDGHRRGVVVLVDMERRVVHVRRVVALVRLIRHVVNVDKEVLVGVLVETIIDHGHGKGLYLFARVKCEVARSELEILRRHLVCRGAASVHRCSVGGGIFDANFSLPRRATHHSDRPLERDLLHVVKGAL